MIRRKKEGSAAAPLFCPRCRKAAQSDLDRRLCPECGDTVSPQGFCLVCERYWLLPVGALCPKHDIELTLPGPADDASAIAHAVELGDGDGVSPLARGSRTRIRLEAEGIPTFLDGERMGEPGMHHAAAGGVKLKVPANRIDDAMRVLSHDWSLRADDGEVNDV